MGTDFRTRAFLVLAVLLTGCTQDYDSFDTNDPGNNQDASTLPESTAGSGGSVSEASAGQGGSASDVEQPEAAPPKDVIAPEDVVEEPLLSDTLPEVSPDTPNDVPLEAPPPDVIDAPPDTGCPLGFKMCSGICRLTSDILVGCGHPTCEACDVPHAYAVCEQEECAVSSCQYPWRDCNSQDNDGCEANSGNDPQNCGGCGKACPDSFSCQQSVCHCKNNPSCNAGSPGECMGTGQCKCGPTWCPQGQRCVGNNQCG